MHSTKLKTKRFQVRFQNSKQVELFTNIFEKYLSHLQYVVTSNLNSFIIKLIGPKQKVQDALSILKQLSIEIKRIFIHNKKTQLIEVGIVVLSAITKGSLSQKTLILGLQFKGYKAMMKNKALYSDCVLDEIIDTHDTLSYNLQAFHQIQNTELRKFYALTRLCCDSDKESIYQFLLEKGLFVENGDNSYFSVSQKYALDEVKENLKLIDSYKPPEVKNNIRFTKRK